jgi:hypothetical protein
LFVLRVFTVTPGRAAPDDSLRPPPKFAPACADTILAKAKKQGELSSDVDLDVMADFIEINLAGIGMAAKAGNSRHRLRKIAVFAGRSYLKADRQI